MLTGSRRAPARDPRPASTAQQAAVLFDHRPVRKLDHTVPIWVSILAQQVHGVDPRSVTNRRRPRRATFGRRRELAVADSGTVNRATADDASFGGVETGRSVMVCRIGCRLQDAFGKWFKTGRRGPGHPSGPVAGLRAGSAGHALAHAVAFQGSEDRSQTAFETFEQAQSRTSSPPHRCRQIPAGRPGPAGLEVPGQNGHAPRCLLVMPMTMRQLHMTAIEQLLAKPSKKWPARRVSETPLVWDAFRCCNLANSPPHPVPARWGVPTRAPQKRPGRQKRYGHRDTFVGGQNDLAPPMSHRDLAVASTVEWVSPHEASHATNNASG